MKKRILSFVSVCLLIASLTTSAFASYNASNVEIEAGSNKTNATVDALLDFIYSKGGREATDSEMQQISDKINEINALYRETMQSCSVQSNHQIQSEIAAAKRELESLPVVSTTYEELVELGFISPSAVDPVPPSPSSTRYVEFKITTKSDSYNGVKHYYTRIFAINAYSSSKNVNTPLYFHTQSTLYDNSDNVDSLVANATKIILSGADLVSDVSIPIFGPDELLGTTFVPRQTEYLDLNAERSLNFAYDYVASEKLPTYYEMCTSEMISFTYYYYYSKLNSNGSLSSQTSPAKTIDKYTTYYDNMTKAKTHAYALFDADPFGHEYYGFDSITVQLRAKVGSKTKTFSKDFALAYYRSLSSVPGA